MYQEKKQGENVFADFARWATRAKKRNPNTSLDEIRIAVFISIVALSVYIFVTGAYFHYKIVESASQSKWAAVAIAALLFGFGEWAKLKLGELALWGILSGEAAKTWRRLVVFSLLAVVVGGVYYWSYDITARGAPTLNKLLNKSAGAGVADSSTLLALEAQAATVTAQVSTAESEAKRGFSVKWRGTTTAEGQRIANKALSNKTKLLEQQADVLANISAERQRLAALKTEQYETVGNTLQIYGAYAEIAQFVLSIINVLLLLELGVMNSPSPTDSSNHTSRVKGYDTHNHALSRAESDRRPIGFFQQPKQEAKQQAKPKVDESDNIVATSQTLLQQAKQPKQEAKQQAKQADETSQTHQTLIACPTEKGTVMYTVSQIIGFVNIYAARIARQEEATGKATDANHNGWQKWVAILAENGIHLEYDRDAQKWVRRPTKGEVQP